MARTSKFGPETAAKIVARLELGAPFTDAAEAAGVKPATAKEWLVKGRRDPDGTYGDFARAVEGAREAAHSRDPMTPDEFRAELEKAVRAGSVNAMKLWAELFIDGEDEQPADDDPLRELDELARRRMRGGA